jgi:hypothetical protein
MLMYTIVHDFSLNVIKLIKYEIVFHTKLVEKEVKDEISATMRGEALRQIQLLQDQAFKIAHEK